MSVWLTLISVSNCPVLAWKDLMFYTGNPEYRADQAERMADSWLAVCLYVGQDSGGESSETFQHQRQISGITRPFTVRQESQSQRPQKVSGCYKFSLMRTYYNILLCNSYQFLSITSAETPSVTRKLASWRHKSMNMWRSSGWVGAASALVPLNAQIWPL